MQKKCPICGHYSTENTECPCRCHDPFRVKIIKEGGENFRK